MYLVGHVAPTCRGKGKTQVVRTVASVMLASLLPNSTGGWIAVIVGAIGLAAAVQQLTSWWLKRKYDRAEQRMLDILRQQIDAEQVQRFAENARKQAEDYERQQEALRRTIAEQIPVEAQRLYFMRRLDALKSNMGRDYFEYLDLSSQLDALAGIKQDPLPPQLEKLIKESALPQHLEARRHAQQLRVLVFILVVLAVMPASLSVLLAAELSILLHPLRFHPYETYLAYGILSLLVAIVWIAPPLGPRLAARLQQRRVQGRPPLAPVGVTFGLLALFLPIAWIAQRNGFYEFLGSQQAKAAFIGIVGVTVGASIIVVAVADTWPRISRRIKRRMSA
ncbi:hypothetical protein AB0E63_44780 [Kribbella sp. NPDC026596]|uniref:hypothetical protein n=1 Tax=Kribbella sp. NPDC026596 TaxID=3155122 RepID=UPI0033F80022